MNKKIFTRLFFCVTIIPFVIMIYTLALLSLIFGWLFTGESWEIAFELATDVVEMYYDWLCLPKNRY